MLHPAEIANLQQTIDRTHAAIGTLASMEQELRLIKKGMAPGAEKTRVEQMLRLSRETISGLQRKLPMLDHARSSSGPDGVARSLPASDGTRGPDGIHGPDGHGADGVRGRRKQPRK